MPRTVVPPVHFRGGRRGRGEPAGGDSLPERLVKYVPAETLAFFVPIAAVLGADRRGWLITVLVVGVAGTVGYLWLAARKANDDEKPLPHFYVLACLAFLCWAIGTSAGVADLVNLDQVEAGVVLGLAVFIIPLGDDVLNRLLRR
ncbi:MAG TPA: hypothetical protein VFT95_14330 [Micromonosporaceae bacterium]|nr:hypothetical protein [Micromonosporaceae bacterium]